ncbi:flagellar motor protein MotB [Lachnospiraceae bacterium MD308]|nr:flagellar motor protein MotB [Lachnospiraceae bacterium MD308]
MKKRNKAPEEGSSWMDTYGDMVTLLLCFFVLLYSISSVDQVKWENLVKSLNPDAAKEVSQLVTTENQPGDDDVPGSTDLPKDTNRDAIYEDDLNDPKENTGRSPEEQQALDEQFDSLYEKLQELKELADDATEVEIAKGEGYTFITFRDKVFFDGDDWVMRDDGKKMIDVFAKIIKPCAKSIEQIQIIGHTSQGRPDKKNNINTDRELSAMRSAVVTAYLQKKKVIAADRLYSSAFGQHRPIASFDTPEDRAKNRRVELLITKTGNVENQLDKYYKQVYGETTTE